MALEPNNPALMVNNETLPNPLALLTQMDSLRKLKNDNLLFRQTNDARVGLGELYGRAVSPEGQLDEAKLRALAAQDPRVSFMLPEIVAQAQKREQEAQAIAKANMENTQRARVMIGETLGGLVGLGPDVRRADVLLAAGKLAAQVGDPNFTKQLMLEINSMPASGPELAKALAQAQKQVMTAKDQFDLTNPTPIVVNDGGRQNIVQAPRVGGSPVVQGSIVNKPTVEMLNRPVERESDLGAKLPPVPAGSVMPMLSGDGSVGSLPAPGASNVPLGPDTEQKGTVQRITEENAKRMASLDEQIANGQRNMMQIEKMRGTLDKIRTGFFADKRTQLAAMLQDLGLGDDIVRGVQGGADPKAVAAAQQFMKDTWSQAMASMKQLTPAGTQWTNQEVMTNFTNSPNLTLDPQAIRELFDFQTKLYEFARKEQDFRSSWRERNPNRDIRQMNRDWADFAEKEGYVKPEKTGPGQANTGLVNAQYKRVGEIPEEITSFELSKLRPSAVGEFELDNGRRVKIRRGSGADGNTYTLVR